MNTFIYVRDIMVQSRVLVFFLGLSELYPGTWSSAIGDRKAIIIDNKISIQEAPYMAAVFLNNQYICGASIINKQFALSAAQCFYGNDEPDNDWKVLVGSDELNTGGILIDVDYPVCHEDYNDATTDNDICVLKLADSIPLGCLWNVDVVRLPQDERKILDGTMVNVLGWGYTDSNREVIGNNLRQITVPMVSKEYCQILLGRYLSNQICAGAANRACTGDAGGPLVYNGVQVGVISYGWSGCDKKPTVFTDVASYTPWINNITKFYRTL